MQQKYELMKNDTKKHYKMYKSGKRWLFAGVTVLGLTLSALPNQAKAAVNGAGDKANAAGDSTTDATAKSASNGNEFRSISADTQETTPAASTDGAQISPSTAATTTAVTQDKTEATTAKTPTAPVVEVETNGAASTAQAQSQTTSQATPAAEQTAQSVTPTTSAAADTTPAAAQQKTDTQAAATPTPSAAATSANSAQDPKTSAVPAKETTVTAAKTETPTPANQAQNTATPALSAQEETAKAAVQQVNGLANTANTKADAVNQLLANPEPNNTQWVANLATALNQFEDAAAGLISSKTETNATVAAYQSVLDAMANQPQPNAVATVTKDGVTTPGTIADYDDAVNAYRDNIANTTAALIEANQKYQSVAALDQKATALTNAADALNTAIASVKTSADNGAIITTNTNLISLNQSKADYDQALAAYNDAIQNYQTATGANTPDVLTKGVAVDDPAAQTGAAQTKDPADAAFDAMVTNAPKVAAQNQAVGAYESAYDAYMNLSDATGTVADAVQKWQKTVSAYNGALNDLSGAQALQPGAEVGRSTVNVLNQNHQAVAQAQNQLQNTFANYENQMADYQSKLATYQETLAAAGLTNPITATDNGDDSLNRLKTAWAGFKATEATEASSNNRAMAQNETQFTQLVGVQAAATNLQNRVNEINQIASRQNAIVKVWDYLSAKTNGPLDGAGNSTNANWAYEYANLFKVGKAIVKADTDYKHAVNGTSDDPNQPGLVVKTDQSYGQLRDALAAAVDQYRDPAAIAAVATNPADIDLAALYANTANFNTILANLAPYATSEVQNKHVLAGLKDPARYSTDGSHSLSTVGNPGDVTIQSGVLFGTADGWSSVYHDTQVLFGTPTRSITGYTDALLDVAQKRSLMTSLSVANDPLSHATSIYEIKQQNGQTYYLAGVSVSQKSNPGAEVQGTNQIYTFETTDPIEEFMNLPIHTTGDKTETTTIMFYYLPVPTVSTDLLAATHMNKAQKLAASVSFKPTFTKVASNDLKLPVPSVQSVDPAALGTVHYLGGDSKDIPAYVDFSGFFGPAPELSLNNPVLPKQPKQPVTPTQPSQPGHHRGHVFNRQHHHFFGRSSNTAVTQPTGQPQTPKPTETQPEQKVAPTQTDQTEPAAKNDQGPAKEAALKPVQQAKTPEPTQPGTQQNSGSASNYRPVQTAYEGSQPQAISSTLTPSEKTGTTQSAQITTTSLPQIGEKSESGLSVIGVILASMVGIFGIGTKKRKAE